MELYKVEKIDRSKDSTYSSCNLTYFKQSKVGTLKGWKDERFECFKVANANSWNISMLQL